MAAVAFGPAGVLYGATEPGALADGTIFALHYNAPTSRLDTLHSFTGGLDGGNTQAGLVFRNGVFDGITPLGGVSRRDHTQARSL